VPLFGKKEKTEFRGQYLGGHPAYPKKRDVKIKLSDASLEIPELKMNIPYNNIKKIENTTRDKMSAGRVILLGVVGALWKKEQTLTVLTVQNGATSQDLVFKFDDVEDAQVAIYNHIPH
jgi:hypothetical protein